MDGRQEAVRRYDHEAGCTGPCGDGDHQSLQHVSREGDRLYRERAEQEGTGGSEKGRALRALSLTLGLTGRGDGGSGSTEERTEPRCRLFFGDFLFFLLLLFLLLFLLFGGGRRRGGGGGPRGRGRERPPGVLTFPGGLEGLHAGLIGVRARGGPEV